MNEVWTNEVERLEGGGPEAEEGWDRRGKVGTGDGEHTRNPKVEI